MKSRKGRPRIYHDCPCCDRCKKNDEVVAFGRRKNKMKTKQVFYCNRCLHKFTPDDGFKNVLYTPEIIMEALALYVRGLSGREVSNHMREFKEVTVGETTVLRWVKTYGGKIADFDRNVRPKVKGRIHNDEVVLKVKGKKCYSINAIDSVTKFNIETYFTEHRDKESFRQFFKNIKAKINDQVMEIYKEEKKKKKEERKLVTFVSDKLEQYKDAFNKYFYRTAKLVHGVPIACRKYGLQHNNTVERHNQFIGRRCDLMRGFKDGNSAATFLSLNRVYYNYIRPHSSLSWGTPAEAAGINLHFEGNP